MPSAVAASPVATPSAGTTPPALPAAKPTPASAVDFVRYFWDAYNYAYATYDTGPLEAISQSSCEFCGAVITDVRNIVSTGGQSSGGTVTVLDANSPPAKITTGTLVTASVSQAPGTLKMLLKPLKTDRGWKRLGTDFALGWDGTQWGVEGVDADTAKGEPWPI